MDLDGDRRRAARTHLYRNLSNPTATTLARARRAILARVNRVRRKP
jgi:hypothetical protein